MATGDGEASTTFQETGGQIFLRLRELTSTELPNGIALASSKQEGRISCHQVVFLQQYVQHAQRSLGEATEHLSYRVGHVYFFGQGLFQMG